MCLAFSSRLGRVSFKRRIRFAWLMNRRKFGGRGRRVRIRRPPRTCRRPSRTQILSRRCASCTMSSRGPRRFGSSQIGGRFAPKTRVRTNGITAGGRTLGTSGFSLTLFAAPFSLAPVAFHRDPLCVDAAHAADLKSQSEGHAVRGYGWDKRAPATICSPQRHLDPPRP